MLRTSLTDAQRSELQTLRRTDLPAVTRDRLEMVLLSAAGWSPPRIAAHLDRCPDCKEEFDALVAIIRAEREDLIS